jgi:hypothetical protein
MNLFGTARRRRVGAPFILLLVLDAATIVLSFVPSDIRIRIPFTAYHATADNAKEFDKNHVQSRDGKAFRQIKSKDPPAQKLSVTTLNATETSTNKQVTVRNNKQGGYSPVRKNQNNKPNISRIEAILNDHASLSIKGRPMKPNQQQQQHQSQDPNTRFASLLPQPQPVSQESLQPQWPNDDPLAFGVSSWEEFLGVESSIPDQLPSIQDLFPPNNKNYNNNKNRNTNNNNDNTISEIEGVLPVSDLFYRPPTDTTATAAKTKTIHTQETTTTTTARSSKGRRKAPRRKMVRRGMDMLVGGVPIHADPPQRFVEIMHDPKNNKHCFGSITLNTDEFGPLLNVDGYRQVSKFERGLFCEYWCHAAMKWDVCPKDLREIVTAFLQQEQGNHQGNKQPPPLTTYKSSSEETTDDSSSVVSLLETLETLSNTLKEVSSGLQQNGEDIKAFLACKGLLDEAYKQLPVNEPLDNDNTLRPVAKGFGKNSATKKAKPKKNAKKTGSPVEIYESVLSVYFGFPLSSEELLSGQVSKDGKGPLATVILRAFCTSLASEIIHFDVDISEPVLVDLNDPEVAADLGDEFTDGDGESAEVFIVEFIITNKFPMPRSTSDQLLTKIQDNFFRLYEDSGRWQLFLAGAASSDTGWPEEVRARFVEECLLEEDDLGETEENDEADNTLAISKEKEQAIPQSDISDSEEDENVGVYPDYSASNAHNAPYRGELGQKLLKAVVKYAKSRPPRVISIGDVHGCIEELQDLLRRCEYRPGDLIVFLGDIVCKGPDSVSVVKMARQIGAIGIRGNHDFEVIRWHQAIKSGVDPPVVGSEHFRIASCLSEADMAWMYSLPWFISSKELSALFVHAGFVSGIRLAKQNPRLMMNMRSILPDGTVTSKFFNNWPWARLWDGPQTVLFGHDADRGLQQYEHAIGLDTGCVYGGRLTACLLPEKVLVSVSARRKYFKHRRKHYD